MFRIYIISQNDYIMGNGVRLLQNGEIDVDYYNNEYGEGGGELGQGAWYVLPEKPLTPVLPEPGIYNLIFWNHSTLQWEYNWNNVVNDPYFERYPVVFKDKIRNDKVYTLKINHTFHSTSEGYKENPTIIFKTELIDDGTVFEPCVIPYEQLKSLKEDLSKPNSGGMWLTFNSDNRSTVTRQSKFQIFYINDYTFKIGKHNDGFPDKNLIIYIVPTGEQ